MSCNNTPTSQYGHPQRPIQKTGTEGHQMQWSLTGTTGSLWSQGSTRHLLPPTPHLKVPPAILPPTTLYHTHKKLRAAPRSHLTMDTIICTSQMATAVVIVAVQYQVSHINPRGPPGHQMPLATICTCHHHDLPTTVTIPGITYTSEQENLHGN